MKYRPRKKKAAVHSRTKVRNVMVRSVLKDPPDYNKLVRAIMLMADEQAKREEDKI